MPIAATIIKLYYGVCIMFIDNKVESPKCKCICDKISVIFTSDDFWHTGQRGVTRSHFPVHRCHAWKVQRSVNHKSVHLSRSHGSTVPSKPANLEKQKISNFASHIYKMHGICSKQSKTWTNNLNLLFLVLKKYFKNCLCYVA